MDGSIPNGAAGEPLEPAASHERDADPAIWAKEFGELVAAVEITARDWGVRSDSLEGRFVAALLGTTGWLGRLSVAAQARFEMLGRQSRDMAELELARAREITKAAQIALSQARNAQISLQVERENVIVRMINETLPLFVEKLQGALVLREKSWNDGVQRRRYAAVGLVTLSLFLGGYALRAWMEGGANDFLGECLAHPLQAQGHVYCDMTKVAQAGR